jgi:flavin reductase (DIM6/NTAB) family NADH-FMN oxidoreductase RutF
MKKSIGPQAIIQPLPVILIGSYDENDKPNVMAAAWAGICSSRPPCAMACARKATQTWRNVMLHRAFTINVPSRKFVREVDYAGLASGKDVDKFERAGLTPVPSENVHAPIVGEFPFALECRLVKSPVVGLHTVFIGEVVDIQAEERVLGENGLPDIVKVDPIVYATGNSTYFAVGQRLMKAFTARDVGEGKGKGRR